LEEPVGRNERLHCRSAIHRENGQVIPRSNFVCSGRIALCAARHLLLLTLFVFAALHSPVPVVAEDTAIVVPEASAKLVQPILDLQKAWLECSGHHKVASCDFGTQNERQSRMSRLLYDLSNNETTSADEALVVLTCKGLTYAFEHHRQGTWDGP
jgi:hypothetical protein